jgi:hypothetical protein
LIAAVAEKFEALMGLNTAPPVQREVMHGTASMRRADYLSGRAVNDDLTL